MAMGMLLLLHEKVVGDTLITLAVEHAMLRLLGRRKGCVMMVRGRTWALAALNKQVGLCKWVEQARVRHRQGRWGQYYVFFDN